MSKKKRMTEKEFIRLSIEEGAEVIRRQEIERHYIERQRQAKSRVEYFQKQLEQDDEYSRLTASLRKLHLKIAHAETFKLPELVQFLSEERRLKAERKYRMEALNIFESDLIPQWQCNKCNDTGILSDGQFCNCY